MINFELALTLFIVLVTLFAVVYWMQKPAKREKRIKQDHETLKLARHLNCDIRQPENLRKVGLNELHIRRDGTEVIDKEVKNLFYFIFGIIFVYLILAVFLFKQQLDGIAIGAIIFAGFCIFFLFRTGSKIKQGRTALENLSQAVEAHEQNYQAERANVKTVSAGATSGEQSTKIIPRYIKPLQQLLALADKFSEVVPEDATLKRHFMTQLLFETEQTLPERPTDSTLKRHYDAMLEDLLSQKLESLKSENLPAAQIVVTQNKVVVEPKLPEDSTLRRHFITEIRMSIEQQLGMPRPTDFNLRRHFDTLVQSLLNKELDEHYS